jgi:hypothetical protein
VRVLIARGENYMKRARRLGMLGIPIGILCTLLTGCIEDQASEAALAASVAELSPSDWSASSTVGPTPQGAHYGGTVVRLNGVTYMVHSGGCDDCNQIWWTKLTPSGWTHNIKIPNQLAADRVSLAAYNGKIYMFHTGDSDTTAIWVSSFNPATEQWTPNYRLAYRSKETPAIIEYRGLLHVVGINTASPNRLWMATMDAAENFSAQTELDKMSISRVSLAVHNQRLVMVRRASWGVRAVDSTEPSIASLGGYLHLVYKSPGSNTLWWTTSVDGYFDWVAPATLGTRTSYADPAIGNGGAGLVLTHTYKCPSGHVCFSPHMLNQAQYTPPPESTGPGGIDIGPIDTVGP